MSLQKSAILTHKHCLRKSKVCNYASYPDDENSGAMIMEALLHPGKGGYLSSSEQNENLAAKYPGSRNKMKYGY